MEAADAEMTGNAPHAATYDWLLFGGRRMTLDEVERYLTTGEVPNG